MASTSSREAALERRRALTNGGKKAEGRFSAAPIRVRTAADARQSRADQAPPAAPATPAAPAPRVAAAAPQRTVRFSDSAPAPSRKVSRPVSNPSRDLVLARREALSLRGKRASTAKDRTRTDVVRSQPQQASPAPQAKAPCKCQEATESVSGSRPSSRDMPSLSLGNGDSRSRAASSGSNASLGDRRASSKRAAQYNPSRALVLARREALSKRGKSASTPTSTTAASVARQVNPDLTSRELAQKVRELKCKVGSAGSARNGGSRPTGPNRNGAKEAAQLAAAADAHWKVGLTETSRGQIVTGTQANRSLATTGNEAGTCRVVTGTEYLGSEVFNTFCQTGPLGTQPAKVAVT
ncbi:MAG: CsoS2 family carboxysome shell protein, partial [Cyanobacteriota bacterium]